MTIGQKVVVTTKFLGIFFGTLKNQLGDVVVLTDGRNCLREPAEVKGFVGLAVTGPLEGSRVGPACDEIELRDVTAITRCSKEAVDRWESEPWS